MQARLFHLHALSALHCGTGRSADVVDLPIARARATGLPIVPGSSLRGVLRQQVTNDNDATALFGPLSIRSDQEAFAGALSIGDAQLLLLPVRCLAGIVSYVTCPFILRRYARDRKRAGMSLLAVPNGPDKDTARVTPNSVNCLTVGSDKLVLEDLDLTARRDPALSSWASDIAQTVHHENAESQQEIVERFAVVPDDVMSFLADTATEVRARIRIDPDTGTVSKGALWYEEHLPAETVLWGVFALSASNRQDDARSGDDLAQALPSPDMLQLGGNVGVGSGSVRFLTAGTRT